LRLEARVGRSEILKIPPILKILILTRRAVDSDFRDFREIPKIPEFPLARRAAMLYSIERTIVRGVFAARSRRFSGR